MKLELKNICKTYNPKTDYEVKALKSISLTIDSGEFLAIMGVSGSGKSTLLHILGCIDEQTSGTYEIDGEDVQQLDLYSLRNRYIGYVLQDFGLLENKSVYENVAYPLLVGTEIKYRDIKEKVMSSLRTVGIEKLAKRPARQSSGGQKQRIAIARALVGNPEVIIADEPTASLDRKTADEIMEIFAGLNKSGRTVIIVTHDIHVAEKCDKIISISDGEIAEKSV